MRIIAWFKTRWYGHKAWKTFKRQTIAKFAPPGSYTIRYNGSGVVTPSPTPQTTQVVGPDHMTNSVNELVAAMDEADKQPPFNERQAKMDIINRKLGA